MERTLSKWGRVGSISFTGGEPFIHQTELFALLERVGVDRDLCISGGVAKNIGVVRRLERTLGSKTFIAHEPQIVGALGAALFASDQR